MIFSRRAVFKSAVGASAIGLGVSAAAQTPVQTQSAQSSASVDLLGLSTKAELWKWQLWMNSLGPKLTGNAAHAEFVNFIVREMSAIPGVTVVRDPRRFTRWEAKASALELQPRKGAGVSIPVTSAYPYSGVTPPGGVTGELVFGGRTPNFEKGDFKGKIVLVEAPILPVMYEEWFDRWGSSKPGQQIPNGLTTSIYQQYCAPDLTQFKKLGAVGVILAWQGVSDADAKDQYIPFSKPYQDIPGLWVGEHDGARLKSAIASQAKVKLTLVGDNHLDATTDSVLAILPGATTETIVLLTHTDGGNAVEENGPLPTIAIAKYLAGLPKGKLRRTYAFAFETGHFAHAAIAAGEGGVKNLVTTHPDLIKQTVACVAIEHFGSREWESVGDTYVPTGENAVSYAITQKKALADLMLECAEGALDDRVIVVEPVQGRFNGEGGQTFRAGVPTLGFLPIPAYLLTAPQAGEIEKVDANLLYSQTRMFARLLEKLDAIPTAALKA